MKGIKQTVDFVSGKRPTDIFKVIDGRLISRDIRFRTHMQSTEAGIEIFVTDDDAAVEDYRSVIEGLSGCQVLETPEAINTATLALHDDSPVIENEYLMVEYIRQTGKDITDIGGKTGAELARALDAKGVPGIRKKSRPCCVKTGKPL